MCILQQGFRNIQRFSNSTIKFLFSQQHRYWDYTEAQKYKRLISGIDQNYFEIRTTLFWNFMTDNLTLSVISFLIFLGTLLN